MRYQTEMMREILTNETAQRIIDFVSPIYGNSYVGLWIYQAIGVIMGEVYEIAEQLAYETNPITAELLLDYWEDHYKIPRDSSLTAEQRRQRILSKMQSRGGCTPYRLSSAVSAALNNIPVVIAENTAKNTFRVTLLGAPSDYSPATNTIEQMKPAHLTYHMRVRAQSDIEASLKLASAITHAENYVLRVD